MFIWSRIIAAETVSISGPNASSSYVRVRVRVHVYRPSLVRELKRDLNAKACDKSIGVFASNVRDLLLQRPVRAAAILGIDPGGSAAHETSCLCYDKTMC